MPVACSLLCLSAPAPAHAQDPETPAAPAPPKTTGPQPVRVTTFLLDHPGVADQLVVPVMRALDEGLKRNPRLEMKDLDTRLADFAQETPQEQVEEGRQLLAEGQKALAALELPVARKKLTQATDALSKVLPYIKKQELAEAMMALAAAEYEDGDRKTAQKTLVRLMTWRSDFRVDTNRYPPQMVAPAEEARREVEKARRGSIEIRSEPAAAQAYVDGRYVGVTPTFAEGLPVGEHFVTLKKEGFRKAVTAATVNARVQQLVSVPLERSGKFLLVEQALGQLEKSIGQPALDASVDNLKEVLFIDHAVFVRAQAAGPDVAVDSWLYDLRTRKQLTHVQQVVSANDPQALNQLAAQLYANVSYQLEVEAPRDAPPPAPKVRPPFYKTWWFWTVTGAVVTGAVLAGTLSPHAKTCGDNGFCPGFTF